MYSFQCEAFDTKVETLYNASVRLLQELIVHRNIDVLNAANNACLHLFNSKLGQKYVGKISCNNLTILQILILIL